MKTNLTEFVFEFTPSQQVSLKYFLGSLIGRQSLEENPYRKISQKIIEQIMYFLIKKFERNKPFVDAIDLVIELKREELQDKKLSELEQIFELFVLIKQNPWNSDLKEFKEIQKEFYYRRIRKVPFWKWKILDHKRNEIRKEFMKSAESDKSFLLDLFVEKIHHGEHQVTLILDEIKEIYESQDQNSMELFSMSLSSYC